MKPQPEQPSLFPFCVRCRQRMATWRVRYDVIGLCVDPNEWHLLCDDCRAAIHRWFKVLEEERLEASA